MVNPNENSRRRSMPSLKRLKTTEVYTGTLSDTYPRMRPMLKVRTEREDLLCRRNECKGCNSADF